MQNEKVQLLRKYALDTRKTVLTMIHTAGSGHCGGSLSAVEILTVLYFDKMRVDPQNPLWPERDRFIASKGHCAPALYAVIAKRGFFAESELMNLRKINHFLQGHPDMKKVPGVDMSTGSLGLGLSAGIGMALAAKLNGQHYHSYVLLGCGEHQEGQVWEAAMAGTKYGLDNLIAIVDFNEVQLDGCHHQIMPLGDLKSKWHAFGWHVLTADGHDVSSLSDAIDIAKTCKNMPVVILAKTVKGKGVSFMEGRHEWHGKPLNAEDFKAAMEQLESEHV